MLINRDSKKWVFAAAAIFAVCLITYVPYHLAARTGPSGGTWPGLLYGVLGTAMILLAMGLTPRKKWRTMRIGRVYWWMQAHVWFGLLSFPVICFHAGFRDGLWGGSLTWALMVLFIVIELSGILGLVFQNLLPGKLLRDVQYETIFEQIDHVVEKLREEAEGKVATIRNRKVERAFEVDAMPAGGAATVTAATTPGAHQLLEFYAQRVVPALQPKMGARAATPFDFDRLRAATPLVVHDAINDLQSIVDERRQLERQRKLHYLLHVWLWFHVPASAAMLVLMVLHVFKALQYHHPW